jgi:hypothetical protein
MVQTAPRVLLETMVRQALPVLTVPPLLRLLLHQAILL